MKTDWSLHPIGVVRSRIQTPGDAPKQGALEGTAAEIVVFPEYAEGLEGIEGRVRGTAGTGGKIIVVCWMHLADRERRKVHPRGQEDRPERGVFATRSPHRPNPVSLHTVELIGIEGTVLRVRGMDAIDGTPVIDIKPHSPGLDG